MTSSHDSSHLRRATPGAALAFHSVCLLVACVACATVVEEPTSMGDVDTSSGLVSTTGGPTSTTSATTNVTPTTTVSTTSAVTSITGTAATTNGVATSNEAATSTSTNSSTLTISATSATSATASSATSGTTASSTTVTSSVGGAGGATTGSFATTVTDGAGGSTSSSTTGSNSTTGGTPEYCDDPLPPAENVAADGSTGAFDTTDGACYRLDFVPADFAGWGCSNFQASSGERTILVNGTSMTCGQLPLPEPVDGGYYFDFGPGTNVSAAMYWWNWE